MPTQSAEKLLQDMMTQYCDYWSSVCLDIKKLKEVLTQLSDQQKLHLLQQNYSGWWTPLQYAALRDDTDIINTLLTSLQSSADRLKLLMVYVWTPLYVAAFYSRTESVKMILDCLTADQQIQIMSAQSESGGTAIRCAERGGHTDTARVLREYQHREDDLMKEQNGMLLILDFHNEILN